LSINGPKENPAVSSRSQTQARSCGTAFQLICNKLTLTFNNLNGYYTRDIFVRVLRSQCLISFLTYLLIYTQGRMC